MKAYIKDKLKLARQAVNQEKAIEKCTYCQPLKKQIEEHHKTVTNVASATLQIAKCPQCRHLTSQIIACAKNGHISEEPT